MKKSHALSMGWSVFNNKIFFALLNTRIVVLFCSLWGWGALDFSHPMFLCGLGCFVGLGLFLGCVGMGERLLGMLDGMG
jgi:hypothetical protein